MTFTKEDQWEQFSEIMKLHMIDYVMPQYGNFPSKTIQGWNEAKIAGKLEAYVDRIGKGRRGIEDQVRDAIKIADFGRYLLAYLVTGSAEGDLSVFIDDMKYRVEKGNAK